MHTVHVKTSWNQTEGYQHGQSFYVLRYFFLPLMHRMHTTTANAIRCNAEQMRPADLTVKHLDKKLLFGKATVHHSCYIIGRDVLEEARIRWRIALTASLGSWIFQFVKLHEKLCCLGVCTREEHL